MRKPNLRLLASVTNENYQVVNDAGNPDCDHSFVSYRFNLDVGQEWRCDIPDCGRYESIHWRTLRRMYFPKKAYIRTNDGIDGLDVYSRRAGNDGLVREILDSKDMTMYIPLEKKAMKSPKK